MNCSRVLLVCLALVLAGCAATGTLAQSRNSASSQVAPDGLEGAGIFVEGPSASESSQLRGAFLPAEWLDVWSLAEEEIAAGEIAHVGRGVRRGPGTGVRRPPLLNARPLPDPLRYWRQRPADSQVVAQARQLYRQRLAEAQERYPNARGYQDHHAIPIYMGGTAKGPTYRLPTAYHQAITQEFRREWPYGHEPPRPQQLAEIMIRVYAKYPIPQLTGIEP